MTKAIELSQLGNTLHVGTDDQIKLLSPGDTSNDNVRIAADFDGSGTKNVYLRVAAREDRRAALVFESVDGNNASTTRWALGRGDSDSLPNTHFYIGTGLSGGSSVSARLVIDNTGNVGIGTTNPSVSFHIRSGDAAPLLLQRTSTANAGIEYRNDTSSMFAGLASNADFWGVSPALNIGGNAALVVTRADGNVGIGTVNPATKLEIVDTATTVRIDGTAGDALLDLRNAGNGNFSGINFTRERNSGPNVVGGSIWMPSDTSNSGSTLYIQAQSASAGAGEDGSLTDNNGVRLKFASGIGADSALSVEVGSTEKFRIKANGNVGIGTNDPITELDIHSSTFSDVTISSARTTGNIGGFNFRKDTGGTPTVMAQMFVTTEGHYNFRAGGNNSSDHALRISANGNVGVGTDNPATKFAVHGVTSIGNGAPSSGAGIFSVKPHNSQDNYFKIRPGSDFESGTTGSAIDIRNSANNTSHQLFLRADRYRLWTSSEKITITSSGLIGINETNPGHFIDMNIGSTNIGMKMTSTDAGSYIQFADNSSTAETSIGAEGNNLKAYVNGNSRLFIDNNGNVGLSTNTPAHKLHVHDGGVKGDYVETSAHAIWTQSVQTGTGGSSGGVILKTNPDQTSSNLSGAYIYRVRAVVRNTGTDTGGTWLVYYKESNAIYEVRLVSRSGTSSNHPRLRIANNNQMELYTTHANSYDVRVITERFYTQEPDSTLHAAGADYHWQRSANNLYYIDGNVGIGTPTVDYGRLNVVNTSPSNSGGLFVSNVSYANNQDKPYLIVGTNNYTGATTNWGTFGFQHRIKTNSGGSPRMTVDIVGGEALCVSSSGNVGLGTDAPQEKLQVEGNVLINGSVIGGVLTAVTNDDAYVDVTPPILGGHAIITAFSTYHNYSQPIGSGMIYYDVGNSRLLAVVVDTDQIRTGGASKLITGGAVTSSSATDFTDNAVTVTTPSGGTLRIFNRTGSSRRFKITFL